MHIEEKANKHFDNLVHNDNYRRKRKISEALIEEMQENDDVKIEQYLISKKRKAHSFSTVRRFRQRVRAREMIDSLEVSEDSEDET